MAWRRGCSGRTGPGGMESAGWAAGRPSGGQGGSEGRTGPEVGPTGIERDGRHLRWGPGGSEGQIGLGRGPGDNEGPIGPEKGSRGQ